MMHALRYPTCLVLMLGLAACSDAASPGPTADAAPHHHDFNGASTGSLFGDDTDTGTNVQHAGAIGPGGPGSHTMQGPH